jgi:hypothetical protein
MENTETINYWVHGDASSSNVDISPQKTITHLKKAILAEEPRISLTTASLLDVYLGNIRDTAEAMGAFSFNNLNLLRGSQRINANFLEGFPDDTIHFVIKRPGKQRSFILSTLLLLLLPFASEKYFISYMLDCVQYILQFLVKLTPLFSFFYRSKPK